MTEDRSGGDRGRNDLKSLSESAESATERAARLRDKAAELRAVAESMMDGPSRRSLLCLAEDYEKLSDYANHRAELARRFRRRVTG
jgi:TPR repeat protein